MGDIMKKNSKKQQQLEAQIKLALLMTALLIFFWTNSIGQTIMLMIPIAILIVGVLFFLRYKQNQILRNSGIKDIDRMDGVRFEYYLKELYVSMGYSVKTTKRSGDFGADLILTKDGRKIVVQAKRYKSNVGLKAIQEANSARSHYNAIDAWVVTNSHFTKAAITLAASNSVKLVDREQLIKEIISIRKEG